MKRGDRIRVPGGSVETVLSADAVQVKTYENLTSWYHPTKVFPVYRHVTSEGRTVYCSVPENDA